jgi:tRNA-splicing endonuclease subunit Sen54
MSYSIWYPSLGRAVVPVARGIHFSTLGHSVARPGYVNTSGGSDAKGPSKRLELLPEEALYLVERGAMHCVKAYDNSFRAEHGEDEEHFLQPPMSVQQAFAEMVGSENLTLERYQVSIEL